MTQRDYELLAAAIKRSVERKHRQSGRGKQIALAAVRDVAIEIAEAAADQNPRFKHYVFLKACGLDTDSED